MTTIVRTDENGNFEYVVEPLSIRDTFALAAMRAFISDERWVWARDTRVLAEESYKVAEAMMKHRDNLG